MGVDKKRNLLLGQNKENIALSITKKNRQRKVVGSRGSRLTRILVYGNKLHWVLEAHLHSGMLSLNQPESPFLHYHFLMTLHSRRNRVCLCFGELFSHFLITAFSQKAVMWTFEIFLIFMNQKASKGKYCRSTILS